MRPTFVCLGATVLLVACDGGQTLPAGPSQISASRLAPLQSLSQTHRLSGVVTAAGVPASGAEIAGP